MQLQRMVEKKLTDARVLAVLLVFLADVCIRVVDHQPTAGGVEDGFDLLGSCSNRHTDDVIVVEFVGECHGKSCSFSVA